MTGTEITKTRVKGQRYVKDGQVAVLVSAGYGAGWSTWNDAEYAEVLLFHPLLVALVAEGKRDKITEELVQRLVGTDDGYLSMHGVRALVIEWVAEGTLFKVTEYDGAEGIEIFDPGTFQVA
jgi:hypothetical protein